MKKTNPRKLLNIILIAAIVISQFNFLSWDMRAHAATVKQTIATKYFYNQLTPDAKVFYTVMEDMYISGDLKKGNVSREITEISNLQEKLKAYASGSQDLLNEMGAGKDAFMLDYPELFYVDYDYISMRVTQDSTSMHLYLGTGRSETYLNQEFLTANGEVETAKLETAIKTVDDRITNLAEKIKTEVTEKSIKKGQDLVEQRVLMAHDEVIRAAEYTFEYQTDYYYTVRTVYGVFGLGAEANSGNVVCAGYARALKAVLDRLEIPAILVTGIVYQNNQPEEHMWVYVQLTDGKWYAVDPTFDNTDKIITRYTDEAKPYEEEVVSHMYFLVGQDIMGYHVPSPIVSTSNFEFTYPELEIVSEKYDTYYNDGLLKVEMDDNCSDETSDLSGSCIRISYNGHGYQKAIDEDKVYIVTNYYNPVKENNKNGKQIGLELTGTWGYLLPEVYESRGQKGMVDTDEYIELFVTFYDAFEVGITDVAPAPYDPSVSDAKELEKQTIYQGKEGDLLARSAIVYNPHEAYARAPHVKTITPAVNGKIEIGKTYPVTIEYDTDLQLISGVEKPSIQVYIEDPEVGYYREYAVSTKASPNNDKILVDNFEWDENRTFTFDFTPLEEWAYDTVYYIFKINGVVGGRVGGELVEPVTVSYGSSYPCSAYAYKSQGFNLNVYGKPVLMDDVNLADILGDDTIENMTEKELADILAIADMLKHQLTLIATETAPKDEEKMLCLLEGGEDCKDEEGKPIVGELEKQANGSADNKTTEGKTPEVLGSQTYNISLTLCKNQLAQLKDGVGVRIMLGFPDGYGPEDEGVTFKAYHYTKDEYGNIAGIEEIPCTITKFGLVIEVYSFSPFTIAAVEETVADKNNQDKTLTFSISNGGKVLDVTNDDEANKNANGVIHYYDEEEQSLETTKKFYVVADTGYVIDSITVGNNVIELNSGSENHSLELKYSKLKELNTMIKVEFVAKTVREKIDKNAVPVTQPIVDETATFTMSAKAYKGSEEVTTLNVGDEFEVLFTLDKLNNVENGINIIEGKLVYDTNKLELIDIVGTSVWNIEKKDYEISTGKFVVTTDEHIKKSSEVFKAKFKVKDSATLNTSIMITDLEAGSDSLDTNAIATATDKIITVNVISEDILEINENDKHVALKGNLIIIPGCLKGQEEECMTYEEFATLITTSKTPVYNINPEGDQVNYIDSIKSEIIKTGDTIKVGDAVWTFSVRGDLDGDGLIDINDLSIIKEHFIEKRVLTGAYLEAAETDGDNDPASVNDISRLKLALIGRIDDLFSDLKAE